MQLDETTDGWRLELNDARLAALHIGFRLGVDIADATSTLQLTVETPCQLRQATKSTSINPTEPATIAPMLPMFNAIVYTVTIQRTGQLTVDFVNGLQLIVNPSDQFEAWQLACTGKFLLVCGPGGGVALFQEGRNEIKAAEL
jgi:hypothetical protein